MVGDPDVRIQLVTPPRQPRLSFVTGLLLLLVRGVLLWLVVPVAAISWLLLWPVMKRRDVSLGSFIGWADLNLMAALERGLFGPFVKEPLGWTPWREMRDVTHRVRFGDPV